MDRSSSSESVKKDFCKVNTKLLPFKLHFFFAYGGFAAVIPFMPIIAKQLGINATALGIGFSMIPIFTFLSNPLIGFLVDYFQNIKAFLIVLLISSSAAYFSILSLPPINYEVYEPTYIQISYSNDYEPLINISKPFKRSCLKEILKKGVYCQLGFQDEIMQDNEITTRDYISFINGTNSFNESENIEKMIGDTHWITFHTKDKFLFDRRDELDGFTAIKCWPTIQQCTIDDESNYIYSTFQFWAFFTFAVVGAVTSLSSNSLSSVACYELLGAEVENYGRQRLFGTISWGIVCPLSGLLNDLQAEKSFFSSVYLIIAFLAIDMIILSVISIPKANVSTNMGRDICNIFSSIEIVVFSFGVAIIGLLNAIIYVFEFWFLEDMGASRTLLGLSIFMQCLVGEVPFLFFSGWFVNKLGHFLCFAFVFCGFLLRLVLYFFLKDPWLVLPVDILHGVTYGLFHGAMASFAKMKAPKGMEATLLGFFGGLYDGLGYGLGSFIGGLGLDKLGPRLTFFSASMLSLGCFVSFLAASYAFQKRPKRNKFKVAPLEMEEMVSCQ